MLPHKIGGCVVVHTVTVTERASELDGTVDSTVAYSCIRYYGLYSYMYTEDRSTAVLEE